MKDTAAILPTASPAAPKRSGRRPSVFWVSFTTESQPYKQREATCRHCHDLVRAPENRQARQALEQLFPANYFHGCMKDALLTLVHHFFVPSAAVGVDSNTTTPFFPELQQFALECKDLVVFLPPNKPSYYRKSSNSESAMHVKATRVLSVEEGFTAIIQAEAFLDKEGVLHQLIPVTSNGIGSGGVSNMYDLANFTPMQRKLIEHVRAPHFLAKLRKYLEVLRPVHVLLEEFCCDAKCGAQPLSEVYPSFTRLTGQFTSSPLLVPEEKVQLQALVRQQYENMLGPAHLLANLLDPVFVGQDFPADLKVDVENKLLSSVNANGTARTKTETEALYMQYTDFQIAARHQKTSNADSFVFRMLKERKKSPLQYWLLDGLKWPELQAVACRVFSMSACIASSSDLFSHTRVSPRVLRDKLELRTIEKLAYVRANAMQLQLAEGSCSGAMSLGLYSLQDDQDADDLMDFDIS
ncbi:hypothetical protein BBO99_00007562 [Phytophthora kernoviae]|uniref:HAT C-terminal dimerisation domain-containing protein n=2 Tax=Phytophthora kernoviae TaxID=325452 RepID=A0A3R7H7A6_9STRA|nr:hypothetical protein G195_009617 [Phytophthora kernoviae 00238/432]KAG2513567.1 hypothetical protein JM18_008447 [Phytophthora kernoviae]KAG2519751.1 hypothetical protein JM16_007019 [Phytophthora kernoviae]RLN27429.1 hypothetical protein BBI17_007505 [Phytophthora kernoviae]RLN76424.1 hypothetical protein BBO99_00007562 [Phytophthora kernoviae]